MFLCLFAYCTSVCLVTIIMVNLHSLFYLHYTPCLPVCSDLPPSQGGRYSGFGNTVEPNKEEAGAGGGGGEFFTNTWGSLSSGWSSFSSNASTWASHAGDKASVWASQAGDKATQWKASLQENVIKPSSEQVTGWGGGVGWGEWKRRKGICVDLCVDLCMGFKESGD